MNADALRAILATLQLLTGQVETAIQQASRIATAAAFVEALRAPVGGSTITLARGAVLTGNFVLGPHSGEPVTITSDSCDGPALLLSMNSDPVIRFAAGASGYVLRCVDVLGNPTPEATAVVIGAQGDAPLVSNITLDRVRVTGGEKGLRRCVFVYGVNVSILNSRISNCWFNDADAQAVLYGGPGPYVLADSYLEASGENVMFGGFDMGVEGMVPSDITITGNTFAKPLAWKGVKKTVKNLLEFKAAQRVLVEGNTFDGIWVDGQAGYAVLVTPRNQNKREPWTVVRDITFRKNTLVNVSSGFNILGDDDEAPSQRTTNVVIEDNVITTSVAMGGAGRCLMVGRGPVGLVYRRNLCVAHGKAPIYAYGIPGTGAEFTGNTWPQNDYGFFGDGGGTAIAVLAKYFPGAVWADNTIIGGRAKDYPAGTVIK